MSSKYAKRMVRLSSKIFGEYRRPELPPEMSKDRVHSPLVRDAFHSYHHRNESVISKLSALPMDLDVQRNPNYYPPHPQHYRLMNKLRDLGLFRDEHLDFREEMVRQRILRGKPVYDRTKRDQNED